MSLMPESVGDLDNIVGNVHVKNLHKFKISFISIMTYSFRLPISAAQCKVHISLSKHAYTLTYTYQRRRLSLRASDMTLDEILPQENLPYRSAFSATINWIV